MEEQGQAFMPPGDLGMFFDFDGNPITMWEWATLRESPKLRVDLTRFRRNRRRRRTRCTISTVWLGINHQFRGGPPIIYETMIFGGPCDGDQWRYHNRNDAGNGHQWMIERVEKAIAALDKPRVKREKAPRPTYKYRKGGARAYA